MKNFLIVFFALYLMTHFTGCSTNTTDGFTSHEEIVEQMNSKLDSERDERGSIDDAEMRRRANLMPLEDLFGEDFEEMKKKKKQKRILIKSVGMEEKARSGADYRYRDTPIKSQWNGTCTTFGGVAGLENKLNKPSTVDLSERDSWSKYKQYSSRAFVTALSKEGNEICREQDWGQNNTNPNPTCALNRKWRLGESLYISDNITSALDALDRGNPVYLAMSTPNDMLYCRSVIRTTTTFSEGGHAILIVGYKMDSSIVGGGYFIIKNNWGDDCGEDGYQYLPFHICNRDDGYCSMWEFKTVIDKSGDVVPVDPDQPEFKWVKKCKRMWWSLWIKKKCWWVKVAL